MMRISNAILPTLCLLAAATAPASAQPVCDGCEWSARGDRSEGVWKEASMISGGSFELMSVSYLGTREAAGGGAQMSLFFWVPEANELDQVLVWKPLPSETNDKVAYKMEPDATQYGAGLQRFVWPRAEVIDRLGLSLDALHPRIRAGDGFVPGLLTTGAAPAPAGGYAFVFDSGAGIDAECTVARDGVPVATFECYEEYGGEVRVEWDGRDDAGQPAADGLYVLSVEGDMLAEVLRPVEATVRFWHRSRLQ